MASEQARELRQQGIVAAKAGRKDEARQLLQQSIRLEPNNEAAWLWLASVARDPRERLFSLRKLLEINPENQTAIKALRSMGVEPTSQRPSQSVSPFSAGDANTSPGIPEASPDTVDAAQQAADTIIRDYLDTISPTGGSRYTWVKKSRRRAGEADIIRFRIQLAAASLGFLAVLGIVSFLIIWNNPTLRGVVFAPTWTPSFTPTATPSSTPGVTPTPSVTPGITSTPSPTVPPQIVQVDQYTIPEPTEVYPVVFERAINEALNLVNQGQAVAAVPTLSVLRQGTENNFSASPYYYEAVALAEAGDTDRALRILEEAEGRVEELNQESQQDAQALIDTGFAYVFMVQAEEEIEEARIQQGLAPTERVINIPGSAGELLTLVEQRATNAIDGDPRIALPYELLSKRFAYIGNFDQALSAVNEGLAINELSTDLTLIDQRAGVFFNRGEYDLARYQAFVVLYADPFVEEAHLIRVQSALNEGDAGLAVLYTQEYLFYYPGSVFGWKLLGDARLVENKPELALLAYSQALQAEDTTPFTVGALLARAELYEARDDWNAAREDYTEAFTISGDPAIQARRMIAAYNAGNYSTAIGDADELLGTGALPDNEIQLVQARALVDGAGADDNQRLNEALTLLQRVRTGLPPELQSISSEYRARVQYELGFYGDARAAVDEALSVGGDTGYRHYLRGLILEAQGIVNDAVREYEWVLTWGEVYPFPFLPDAQLRYDELTGV